MGTIEYLRQFRFLDYAIFDLSATFIGMALAAPLLSKLFLGWGIIIPKRSWFFWALLIGVVVHLLFGAMTPMTVRFMDPQGSYGLKIVVLGLFAAGFIGVKRKKK